MINVQFRSHKFSYIPNIKIYARKLQVVYNKEVSVCRKALDEFMSLFHKYEVYMLGK